MGGGVHPPHSRVPAGTGFAGGGILDQMAPGPALAAFTAGATARGLSVLSDDELAGVLCARRRLASWAAAGQAGIITELHARRALQAAERKNAHLIEHVSDEIAAALTLTGRSAQVLLDISLNLARLPLTRAALTAGIIDWARATVITTETGVLSGVHAAEAEAAVLPGAGDMTTTMLRRALRRFLLTLDPEAAGERRRAAQHDARVELRDEPSGTSTLAGRDLPAAAITAGQQLTARARWLQARGVTGTLPQLRAAVFLTVLTGRPLTTLLNTPATDPASNDKTTTGPGATGPVATGTNGTASTGSTGSTSTSNADAAGTGTDAGPDAGLNQDGTAPDASTPDAGAPGRDYPPGPGGVTGNINLTMPLSAYQGRTDNPGEAAGYGPPGRRHLPGPRHHPHREPRHHLVPHPHQPRRASPRPRLRPRRTRPARTRPQPVARRPQHPRPGNRDLHPHPASTRLPAPRPAPPPHQNP